MRSWMQRVAIALLISGTLHAAETNQTSEVKSACRHTWEAVEPGRPVPSQNSTAGLGQYVRLEGRGFAAEAGKWRKNQKSPRLFINGIEQPGIEPCRLTDTNVVFQLLRDPTDVKSAPFWNRLLRRPFLEGFDLANLACIREVTASIGPSGGDPLPSSAVFKLRVIALENWVMGWLVVLAIILLFFVWLLRKSMILRDGGRPAGDDADPAQVPYSLARVQLAFWTLLVLVVFVTLWIISGDLHLNGTALILMGISGSTYLASAAADPGTLPAKRKHGKKGLHGFFLDILTEGDGIAFHRFQILAWTLVLGIIFAVTSLNELRLPDFDATLLGLMGISSGAYVSFKMPALNPARQPPAGGPPPPANPAVPPAPPASPAPPVPPVPPVASTDANSAGDAI